MTSLVLAMLLSADALGVSYAPPAPPRLNLFSAPASSLGMLGGSAVPGNIGWAYLPVGATVLLAPEWGVTFELAGAFSLPRAWNNDGWALSGSAGPTFFLSNRGMDGFFVSPKLSFQVAHPASQLVLFDADPNGPIDFGPHVSRSFLVGADVGYQLRFGHLTLGFVLGASVGYAFDQDQALTTPFSLSTNFGNRRSQGYCYALNLNFFRLGYAI